MMISIPRGTWAIESVLANGTTVVNNDRIRTLEVLEHEWFLQPSGQPFQVVQLKSSSAVLKSFGEIYLVDFEVTGNHLSLHMSRPDIKERISFEAEAITADVFVNVL